MTGMSDVRKYIEAADYTPGVFQVERHIRGK